MLSHGRADNQKNSAASPPDKNVARPGEISYCVPLSFVNCLVRVDGRDQHRCQPQLSVYYDHANSLVQDLKRPEHDCEAGTKSQRGR